MPLRSRLRSLFGRVSRTFGAGGAVDHPANGGITGDLEPSGDDLDSAEKSDRDE